MTTALVFSVGACYAGGLWLLATHVARQRRLALGAPPYWALLVCGCAAVGVNACVEPNAGLTAGATLIGAIVCALVDARTGFIFDALSLTILIVVCTLGAIDGALPEGVLAAVIVGSALAGLYLLTGRRGIGLGDVKLGSVIALGYGVGSALIAVGSAFVLGAIYAVLMLAFGRAKRSDAIRFGPFLAGGSAVALTANALGWRW